MKRALSILIALLLCVSVFVGCEKPDAETLVEKHENDCENIDQKLASEIKIAYSHYTNDVNYGGEQKFTPEDIFILRYEGEIGGCHFVMLGGDEIDYTTAFRSVEVAGYVIEFGSGQPMYAYKKGSFYTLKQAYDNGILTDSDVYEIGSKIDSSFIYRYTSMILQTNEGISSVNVSSLPEGYNYSFNGEAAKAVADYFINLNLISDYTENPNEYVGMTWVVNVDYDNGIRETLYHFGNMFVRHESGSWYKMNYDEAARFDALLTELSDNLNGNSDVNDGGDFEPGVILLGLKEQYEGDIRELLPELSIAEVEDTNLKWYEQIKDLPDMEQKIENARSKIGTEFIIKLTETTKEAVLAGVYLIEGNPIVDYVTPNYVVEPSCKGDN